MKVKLKSVIKTLDTLFEPFEENQIVFHAGNTLAIKQFYKPSCEFIHLTKQLTHLFSFKPTPSKQGCFVAEKILNQKICISLYNLKKQRKSVCLSDSPQFFPSKIVQSVELLVDQFDSSLVYGYAKAGLDTCIFLIDFNKMRTVSMGFVNSFNDIKVNSFQNLTLTFCYGNAMRVSRVFNGFWQTDEKVYKKLGNVNIVKHEIFAGEVKLFCTRSHMYFVGQQAQVIQTITVFQFNDEEIHDVLKLNKAILVLGKKGTMKVYVQDHDEVTYLYKGQLKIKLQQNQKINKIALSSNCQEVLLRTNKNSIYIWKVDELEANSEIFYGFQKIQNGTIGQPKGSISLASGKKVALLSSDNSISLWDLDKNTTILETTFKKFDKQSEKALYAAQLNPDGNSLICSFEDKIKIYKILLTKLRFVAEFNLKKCSQLIYSHGGQYVACKYGKGVNSSITIVNTIRMIEITTIKTQSEPSFILWNEMDDELIYATVTGQMTMYKIAQSAKRYCIRIPSRINYIRLDYSTKKMLVSSDQKIFVIGQSEIQMTIQPKIPKFNFIYPLHGFYFITTKDGNLYWSNQLTFQNYQQLPVFINKQFEINYRNDYMIASSSFQNITLIECQRPIVSAKKQLLITSENIVFVQKDEINRFFQKIKNLQSALETLQNVTAAKIQDEKRIYSEQMNKNIKKFQEEISFLQKRYQEIYNQKLKQEKQNSRIFDELEQGQIKSVNDLQKMYDRKLRLEKEKSLEMQQKNVQQRVHYEKVIYELQKRYHDDISKIREQYSTKLNQQYKRVEQIKKNDIEYKKKMEFKLISVEEESELTMFEIQKLKDQQIEELKKKIQKLENQQNSNKVEFHNQIGRYQQMEETFQLVSAELKKHKEKLSEARERIKLLEEEIVMKDRMIEQRNNVIAQHEHHIGGLQKAKYVLSFRTTQTRKQLQPKQFLIDKLKQQMFKLQQQYKEQKKKSFELNQKLEKVDKLSKILKEENVQLGIKLKNKQNVHEEMSGQIFTIVNQMDLKEWPPALVKVYQTYIKEDHFKNMKKKTKDDTSEEINRHLTHVQQSLMQVTAGNQKIFKAKELDVKRKMKQNAELILEFNQLKKKYKESLKKIDEEKTKVAKLQQNLNQMNKGSTRSNTAKSTRRAVSRQRPYDRIDQSNMDMSFKPESEIYFQKRQISTRQSRNRASFSGYRTMILRSTDKKENSRLFDLAKELQTARYKIQKQQKMIEQLNERLLQNSIS